MPNTHYYPILENIGQYPIPQCQYHSNPISYIGLTHGRNDAFCQVTDRPIFFIGIFGAGVAGAVFRDTAVMVATVKLRGLCQGQGTHREFTTQSQSRVRVRVRVRVDEILRERPWLVL